MGIFSRKSLERLSECDARLQEVFQEVIKHVDCVLLWGHRGERDQNECFERGTSTVKWPKSKHNSQPSMAVDVAPCPVDWKDEKRFILFAGFVMGIAKAKGINLRWVFPRPVSALTLASFVMGIAKAKGINLRWGGDWNGNFRVGDDGKLFDGPHFEVVESGFVL